MRTFFCYSILKVNFNDRWSKNLVVLKQKMQKLPIYLKPQTLNIPIYIPYDGVGDHGEGEDDDDDELLSDGNRAEIEREPDI